MSPAELPLVSVLIPLYHEAERIECCLRAVLDQDWPVDRVQLVVVDGAPGDGTGAVVERVLSARPGLGWTVVPNPGGGRSSNLNRGLGAVEGDVVCRVDARSALPPGYLRACVALLADPTKAVVGGSQVTVPAGPGVRERGIARGLNNRVAMGMARYRRNGPSGPVDTVYLGAFRTEDLRSVGGWDEGLVANEDFDLNQRMGAKGLVWYSEDLAVAYTPRSTLREINAQYWGFGRWKVRYLRASGARPRPRQLVGLAVAPASLALAVGVARCRPSSRRRVLAGLAGVAVLVEHVGAAGDAPPAPVAVRAWSLATAACVTGSWSFGAWSELVRKRGPGG